MDLISGWNGMVRHPLATELNLVKGPGKFKDAELTANFDWPHNYSIIASILHLVS